MTDNTFANTRWLIVDDDQVFATTLARAVARELSSFNIQLLVANDGYSALKLLRHENISHVILDLKLSEESGLHLIPEMLQLNSGLKILMLTGYASIATAVDAIKLGAIDYLPKPVRVNEVLAAFKDKQHLRIDQSDQRLSPSQLEWEHIQRVLAENDGNISATARVLGMHRRTLQRKLSKKKPQ